MVETDVMFRPLVYGPAACPVGIARVRLAPRVVVPNPLPTPACTDASTAAVVPRPGLPGVTVPPSVTPWVSGVVLLVGVHPSWLPEMVAPAAVPEPVQLESCPDTDQPGKVFRVSDTTIGVVAAVALDPDTARVTVVVVFTVSENAPVDGTVTASGMTPEFGGAAFTVSDKVPLEAEKLPVGVNAADSASVPAAANDVVVLAVPPETVTGVPMAVPPTENCTEPVALAGETVAVRVTV